MSESNRITKIKLPTRNYILPQGNFSQIWGNILQHLFLEYIFNYPLWSKILTISSIPIYSLTWWFQLFLPKIWLNAKDKMDNFIQELLKGNCWNVRYPKHNQYHNIGWYPKDLLIFNYYQLQGWCTIILSPVKAQPDRINVKENLQKWKKPQYGFYTHLFYASTTILIFGGLFQYRLFVLITVKPKCMKVTTSDF